jgi:hypothetical protein
VGVVKRENGKYLLTQFGKMIYFVYENFEAMIDNTINNYLKLKVIEPLQISRQDLTQLEVM